jgi:hypothetical protein
MLDLSLKQVRQPQIPPTGFSTAMGASRAQNSMGAKSLNARSFIFELQNLGFKWSWNKSRRWFLEYEPFLLHGCAYSRILRLLCTFTVGCINMQNVMRDDFEMVVGKYVTIQFRSRVELSI